MTDVRGVHPAAEVFPLIEGAEFDELVESIRKYGLSHEIVLDNVHRVLDGRNRLAACKVAGVEPRFTFHLGDAWEYVWRENVNRRHLTPSQKALAASDWALAREKDLAKERQRQAGRRYGENHPKPELVAPGPQALETGRATERAAEAAGVSERTLRRVERVRQEAPELMDRIREGTLTAKAAERAIEERRAERQVAAPPMPAGMKRSPTVTDGVKFERAANQINVAITAAGTLEWSQRALDVAPMLRKARGILSGIINDIEREDPVA